MANPMEMFFKLGDFATKGDPKRKLDFDYGLMWIIMVAFVFMCGSNLLNFIKFQSWTSVSWILIGAAMIWFQYWNLKQFYHMREMIKKQSTNSQPKKEMKIESVEDMMKEFKEEKKEKDIITEKK